MRWLTWRHVVLLRRMIYIFSHNIRVEYSMKYMRKYKYKIIKPFIRDYESHNYNLDMDIIFFLNMRNYIEYYRLYLHQTIISQNKRNLKK
jgi:hypothetical protein